MAIVKVRASDMAARITLKVKMTDMHTFWLRFWMCRQLLKLAAMVAGVGIRIDEPVEESE